MRGSLGFLDSSFVLNCCGIPERRYRWLYRITIPLNAAQCGAARRCRTAADDQLIAVRRCTRILTSVLLRARSLTYRYICSFQCIVKSWKMIELKRKNHHGDMKQANFLLIICSSLFVINCLITWYSYARYIRLCWFNSRFALKNITSALLNIFNTFFLIHNIIIS